MAKWFSWEENDGKISGKISYQGVEWDVDVISVNGEYQMKVRDMVETFKNKADIKSKLKDKFRDLKQYVRQQQADATQREQKKATLREAFTELAGEEDE